MATATKTQKRSGSGRSEKLQELLEEAKRQPGVKEAMEVFDACSKTEQEIANVLHQIEEQEIVTTSNKSTD